MSKIYEVSISDLDLMADMLPEALAESPVYSGMTPEPNLLKATMLSDPAWCAYIAKEDGKCTGFLIGQIQRGLFFYQTIALTVVYYVIPEKRGTPLPFRLLAAFHKWAEKNKVHQVHVGIAGGTRVEAGYKMLSRLGYNLAGVAMYRNTDEHTKVQSS